VRDTSQAPRSGFLKLAIALALLALFDTHRVDNAVALDVLDLERRESALEVGIIKQLKNLHQDASELAR
jgi:hypothetical protein